ncbi:MAG: fumarylacetoacetate hydrolase family protein [Rhodoferax sp.]|uniref:fumarylacetoacetate hydrolase family protein n=1 Tax=Rhodoferax sp. TaxID=50421 RepID=UPI002604F0E2|nr:fumarylacetoacetate hydrolase family protein [Rhodoferax sp.]MDD2881236.1 fumarylacetoacetate hydrolase family protein [Rhodoferax sp.]
MKLATLNDGSRDGQLVVVSTDLASAHYATGIAEHLQQVLDDWSFISPQLQDLYDTLNHGKARHAFAFDARQCMAPLPRAYLLAVGDAYPSPAETQAATASLPNASSTALHLGFADALLGARAPLTCAHAAQYPDFAASVAVMTGDVAQGATPEQALDAVRLLALASHTHYRAWQDQPALALMAAPHTALSPVAVTPDELVWAGESAWAQGRLSLTLQCSVNGRKFGACNAGHDMRTHFGELMAQLCLARRLRAGSIVSSGEVRQLAVSAGCSSIATRRGLEMAQSGSAKTPWLAQGDNVTIDMMGPDGQSVFGAIDQDVQVGPQTALPAA